MLILVLNKLLGGTWRLKQRCEGSKSRLVKSILSLIYVRALQEKGSWISVAAHFAAVPCFPHGIYGSSFQEEPRLDATAPSSSKSL